MRDRMKRTGLAAAMLSFLLAAMALIGCAPQVPTERSGFLLDTYVEMTLYGMDEESGAAEAKRVLDGAFDLCRAYEQQFSRTIAESDIARINAAQGQPVEVNEETAWLLAEAAAYSRASDGFFDVTIGGASALWDFKAKKPSVPADADIAAALEGVGYEKINIEGNVVTLVSAVTQLDLGAIAKGYISDKLAAYMQAQGVPGAVINLGGNVVTVGSRPNGEAWGIGVQKPFAAEGELVGVLRVTGLAKAAIVSTGVYERSFTLDGTLYHHILNPQTGRSAESDMHAVTIIAESGMAADVLGTMVFGLGAEEGLAYLEQMPDVEGIVIRADGRIDMTTGIGADGAIAFDPQ